MLVAARRANDFGRGTIDDRIVHVLPLIEALSEAVKMHDTCREEAHALMATVRLYPYYSQDPMFGAEPLAHRWVVWRSEAFHRAIERLRERFPLKSEFID